MHVNRYWKFRLFWIKTEYTTFLYIHVKHGRRISRPRLGLVWFLTPLSTYVSTQILYKINIHGCISINIQLPVTTASISSHLPRFVFFYQIDSDFVQNHSSILLACLRIVPFLSFGDAELMQMLIDHFISALNLEK